MKKRYKFTYIDYIFAEDPKEAMDIGIEVVESLIRDDDGITEFCSVVEAKRGKKARR